MRLSILRNILFSLFLVLLLDIFWMQIVKGPEYLRQSENNRIRLVAEEASRGIIYDCNNIPLVENKLAFDIVVVPNEFKEDTREAIFLKLSRLLNIEKKILLEIVLNNSNTGFSPLLIASDVSGETAFLIEQEITNLPGVFVQTRARRQYIYKEVLAHVIGYVGKMREDEYPQLKKYGYQIRDVIGRSGLEKTFDEVLRGNSGGMQLEVNSAGNIINVLGYRPPVRGKDLYTTIDIKLQQLVYELIGGLKGGIAVMDARTGEILSLCSSPSFDPNIFIDKNMNGAVKKVMQDIDSPLLNRVVNAYPPGSIFKVVTAYAGLAEKNINPESAIFCPGKFKIGDSVRFCWLKRGHKEVFLKTALAGSCNVYFWEIGLKIGEKILSKYAKEFSLGKLTGIELPGESAGVVPDSKWKSLQLHQRWYGGDTINFSIGQGYLLVSPIQALRMIAFVANEGYEVSPHILKKQAAIKNKKVLNPDFFDIIKQGMYEVVNSPFGTGYNAFIENARIFAKTGTAQVFGQIPHAWFAGFVEIKDRKICFIVFLENGGHGGESAALIAKQIVAYFNNNN